MASEKIILTGDQEAYERNVGSVASSIESIVASVPAREQAPTALLAITYSGGIRAPAGSAGVSDGGLPVAGAGAAGAAAVSHADEKPLRAVGHAAV